MYRVELGSRAFYFEGAEGNRWGDGETYRNFSKWCMEQVSRLTAALRLLTE